MSALFSLVTFAYMGFLVLSLVSSSSELVVESIPELALASSFSSSVVRSVSVVTDDWDELLDLLLEEVSEVSFSGLLGGVDDSEDFSREVSLVSSHDELEGFSLLVVHSSKEVSNGPFPVALSVRMRSWVWMWVRVWSAS